MLCKCQTAPGPDLPSRRSVRPPTLILSGVFTPVDDERDASDLPVKGRIPEDLRGVYPRNGPNSKFPPLGTLRLETPDSRITELPRIDNRRQGRPTRYRPHGNGHPDTA